MEGGGGEISCQGGQEIRLPSLQSHHDFRQAIADVKGLRIRQKGSAGGQKGLNDILRACGTQSIARLRVGVDPPPPRWDAADYVLGKFPADQKDVMHQAVDTACLAVVDWIRHDLAHCMNQFN